MKIHENKYVVMFLNFGAFFAFLLEVGDLFLKPISGTDWWNFRLGADHLLTVVIIETVSLVAILLLVRSFFFDLRSGFFAAFLEVAVYITLTSLGYDAILSMYSHKMILSVEDELVPLMLALLIAVRGRSIGFERLGRRLLIFTGVIFGFLGIWVWVFGFHITMDFVGGGTPTQYFHDYVTNLIELGYWGIAALAYQILLWKMGKNAVR